MMRSLLLPKARKARDVFASASLFPHETGGRYRDQTNYVVARAAFVSALRSPGFAFFGPLGASYEWSAKWLERGEHIRSQRGGANYFTAAVPTDAAIVAYGDSTPTTLTGAPAQAYLAEWQSVLAEFSGALAIAVFSRLAHPVEVWATDELPGDESAQWEKL